METTIPQFSLHRSSMPTDNPDTPISKSDAAYDPTTDLPEHVLRLITEDSLILFMSNPEDWETLNVHKKIRREAEAAGAIAEFPQKLAVITLNNNLYLGALTLTENTTAYIRIFSPDKVKYLYYSNEVLCYRGTPVSNWDLERFSVNKDNTIPDINLPILQCLYTLALNNVENTSKNNPDTLRKLLKNNKYIEQPIRIYVRDLLKWTGYAPNSSRDTANNVIQRVQNLQAVFGFLVTDISGQKPYPVLDVWEYDSGTNTVCFRMPYLRKLAIIVLLNGIECKKPSHSYLLLPKIVKQRGNLDNEVFEVITTLIQLIERAGGNGAHMKVGTLLEHCPCLKRTLSNTGATNRHTVLKRILDRVWADLKEYTSLYTDYDSVRLPQNDIKYSPSQKGQNQVIEIEHNGKKKDEKADT